MTPNSEDGIQPTQDRPPVRYRAASDANARGAGTDVIRLVETFSRDVMISFNSKDEARAAELYAALRQAGLTVYCSKYDIQPMDQWRSWVSRAAHNSKLLIALSSKGSYGSQHVAEELVLFKERMDALCPRDIKTEYGTPPAGGEVPVRLEILNVLLDASPPWVWTDEQKRKYEAHGVRESDPRFAIKLILAGKQYITALDQPSWQKELPRICRIAAVICNTFDETTRSGNRPPTTIWKYRQKSRRWARGKLFSILSNTYKTAFALLLAVAVLVGAVFATMALAGLVPRPPAGPDREGPRVDRIGDQVIPFDKRKHDIAFGVFDNQTAPDALKVEVISESPDALPAEALRLAPYQPGVDRVLTVVPPESRKGHDVTVTLTVRATDANDNTSRTQFKIVLERDRSVAVRTHGLIHLGRNEATALSFAVGFPPTGGPAVVGVRGGVSRLLDVNASAPIRLTPKFVPQAGGGVAWDDPTVEAMTAAARKLKGWLETEEQLNGQKIFLVLDSDATFRLTKDSVARLTKQLREGLGLDADVLKPVEQGRWLFAGVMGKLNNPPAEWRDALVIDVGPARVRGTYKNTARNEDQAIFDDLPGPATLLSAAEGEALKRHDLNAPAGRAAWLKAADTAAERFDRMLVEMLNDNVAWNAVGKDAPIRNVYLTGEAVRVALETARPEVAAAVGAETGFRAKLFTHPLVLESEPDFGVYRRRLLGDGDPNVRNPSLEVRLTAAAVLKRLSDRLSFSAEGRTVYYFNDADFVWQAKYLEARLNRSQP